MKAFDVPTFREALSRQLILRWNFLCTDAKNIYWVHNGVVARRAEGYDWRKPVPGWTKDTEWGPYLPFSANPQLFNPPSGFVQNCNNPPWVATRNSGLKPLEPASYYLESQPRANAGEEVLNTRGERIFGVLTRPNAKFTLQQMMNLGLDTYILAADVIVPLFTETLRRKQPIEDARMLHAVQVLANWNRRATKDSPAYTYLFYWAKAYRRLFSDRAFDRFADLRRYEIDVHSRREQERAWLGLREAVNGIQAKFGTIDVPWGTINVVLRGGVFPLDGPNAFGVLHPDEGAEQQNGRIYCDRGWGHLMVVMEGNPKQVWSLLPYGESQDVQSRHYNDQAKLHSDEKLKPFWFKLGEILNNSESVWGDPRRMRRLVVRARSR